MRKQRKTLGGYFILPHNVERGPKNRTVNVDNLATVSGRKACYMSRVSEFCTERAWNLHVSAVKCSLPDLHNLHHP